MSNSPSIYIARKNKENDDMPERSSLSKGDIVILSSGDILVWSKNTWFLLPGRYLEMKELKKFVGYIGSGWPTNSSEVFRDLGDSLPEVFLKRMEKVVAEMSAWKDS
jgi:hypothetical protein